MENIDTEFPVFALVFCVFSKNDYSRNVEPGVRELKFKYFGHDVAILQNGKCENSCRRSVFCATDLILEKNSTMI